MGSMNDTQTQPISMLEKHQLIIDQIYSSCPQHADYPLIGLSFDYFPSNSKSSIIRFKCEKCRLMTANDEGIPFHSKWFAFKDIINHSPEPSLSLESVLMYNIVLNQFIDNPFNGVDSTDRNVLLPIRGKQDQMYSPSDVRNSLLILRRSYFDPFYEKTKSLLSLIVFEPSRNLQQKQIWLQQFSKSYLKMFPNLESCVRDLIPAHRQLKDLPVLQPPKELSREQIEILSANNGKKYVYFYQILLSKPDFFENLTIDFSYMNGQLNFKQDEDFTSVTPRIKYLKSLNLAFNGSGGGSLAEKIAEATNLTSLKLQKVVFKEELASVIASMIHLQHLNLQIRSIMSARDLHDLNLALSRSNQLITLDIKIRSQQYVKTTFIQKFISSISQNTQLAEFRLSLRELEMDGSDFICFGEALSKLKNLKKLSLIGIAVGKFAEKGIQIFIESLAHLKQLIQLNILLHQLSEVVLGSLNQVLVYLKQLRSLSLTLQDTEWDNKTNQWKSIIEGNPKQLLSLASNIFQLNELETLELSIFSSRLNLQNQEKIAAAIKESTKDLINFSALKISFANHDRGIVRNILCRKFVDSISTIENITFLGLHFNKDVAIPIFESFTRMPFLRYLEVQITKVESKFFSSSIQSLISQMTQLSYFSLTINGSELMGLSLTPLVESIRKLQHNLLFFSLLVKGSRKTISKLMIRRLKSMRNLSTLIVKQ